MKKYIAIFILYPFLGFGQSEGKVWAEYGVKGEINKKMDWAGEMTTRFGSEGLETFFPQASLKYKVTSWFRPSIDYRAIFSKDDFKNYSFGNRLNFNANFKFSMDRLSFAGRIRYQYAFGGFGSSAYNVEFDQAFRFKPEFSYDIDNSFITPVASIEFFYNPNYGPYGQRFTKYRAFIGVEFELDSPHEFSVGYILDQKIQVPNTATRHVLNISYSYNLGYKPGKNKK